MRAISDAVSEFLQNREIKFHAAIPEHPQHRLFMIPVTTRNCIVSVLVIADDEERYLRVMACGGLKANPDHFGKVSEFVTKANYGQNIGALWIHPEEGEISYVCSSSLGRTQPTEDMFMRMLQSSVGAFDHYYPGLIAVLHTGAEPGVALSMVEGPKADIVEEAVARLLSQCEEPSEDSAREGSDAEKEDNDPSHRKKGQSRARKRRIEEQ